MANEKEKDSTIGDTLLCKNIARILKHPDSGLPDKYSKAAFKVILEDINYYVEKKYPGDKRAQCTSEGIKKIISGKTPTPRIETQERFLEAYNHFHVKDENNKLEIDDLWVNLNRWVKKKEIEKNWIKKEDIKKDWVKKETIKKDWISKKDLKKDWINVEGLPDKLKGICFKIDKIKDENIKNTILTLVEAGTGKLEIDEKFKKDEENNEVNSNDEKNQYENDNN